jgi:hypothetical protein
MNASRRDELVGLLVLLAVFSGAVGGSLGFPPRARIYPLFVGGLGVLLSLAGLWTLARQEPSGPETAEASGEAGRPAEAQAESLGAAFGGIVPYLAWLLAYFVLMRIVGLVLASGIFVALFLRREGHVARGPAVGALVAVCAFLLVVGSLFGLHWPVSVVDPFQLLGLL